MLKCFLYLKLLFIFVQSSLPPPSLTPPPLLPPASSPPRCYLCHLHHFITTFIASKTTTTTVPFISPIFTISSAPLPLSPPPTPPLPYPQWNLSLSLRPSKSVMTSPYYTDNFLQRVVCTCFFLFVTLICSSANYNLVCILVTLLKWFEIKSLLTVIIVLPHSVDSLTLNVLDFLTWSIWFCFSFPP